MLRLVDYVWKNNILLTVLLSDERKFSSQVNLTNLHQTLPESSKKTISTNKENIYTVYGSDN